MLSRLETTRLATKRSAAILLAAMAALVVTPAGAAAQGVWDIQTVVSGASPGSISLDFNPLGNPAIAYGNAYGGWLAEWDGISSWQLAMIDDLVSGPGGPCVDLAYDPTSGSPTVSYSAGELYFAKRTGSSWSSSLADKFLVGDEQSLAYDGANHPAISYLTLYKGKYSVGLVRWDGTKWIRQIVHQAVRVPYIDLAYDSAGNPAIAYATSIDGFYTPTITLRLARWNGTTWIREVVETGPPDFGGYGNRARLAFDPTTGSLAMLHGGAGTVRFVRWNGSSWQGEPLVTTAPSMIYGCALCYGPDGTAYAAWGTTSELKVARRDPASGQWTVELVDSQAENPRISIQRAPSGTLAVTYRGAGGSLKFATKAP